MLYVVYVNNKGFICTFDKMEATYTTTKDIYEADYSTSFEEAKLITDVFSGEILCLREES